MVSKVLLIGRVELGDHLTFDGHQTINCSNDALL